MLEAGFSFDHDRWPEAGGRRRPRAAHP
ncbi:hypothetical protein OG828_06345 [Streptomyces sp. NBC_00457]